jgi:ACS family hexuronate transporter-like MFS transporter
MPESLKTGNYRWTVCALIFFATTVNYLDRQVIGILKPLLESDLAIGEKEYSYIVVTFQLFYAFGMAIAGRLIDKFGTRIGYGVSVIFWSIAAMGHALAKGALGFGFWRGLLGISESGNFPAAIKSVAEWFPKKERALATGIFNSGTNIGAVIAPVAVPAIVAAWGWQTAFIATGAIGFIWIILWFIFYEVPEKQRRVKKAELDYIRSDGDQNEESQEKIPWVELLKYRQTWIFFIGKGMTDPIWWFYLFWIPGWLAQVRHTGLDVKSFGLPLVFIYSMTTVGSIFGGWLSSFMITKGMSPYRARKITMFIFALLVIPVVFASSPSISTWGAVILIAIAAASHQAWSANIYTTVSDAFPKRAVSSVTGFGGMAGALGGAFISYLAGFVLDLYKKAGHIETGYLVMFVIAGSAYMAAWIIMAILAPKNTNVELL